METRLHKSDVRRWLEGHREAEKLIRKERVASLRKRSTGDAWTIYLSLVETRLGNPRAADKPSYTLVAMRRVLDRRLRRMRPAA